MEVRNHAVNVCLSENRGSKAYFWGLSFRFGKPGSQPCIWPRPLSRMLTVAEHSGTHGGRVLALRRLQPFLKASSHNL